MRSLHTRVVGLASMGLLVLGTTTYQARACAGDIAPNGGDGVVNIHDLLALIKAMANKDSGPAADINGDRRINQADVLALVANWGRCRGPKTTK